MIVLSKTTDSLEIKLDGAVATSELPFYASYVDHVLGVSYSPDRSDGSSSGVGAVTAVAAPAASTIRQVKLFGVTNSDTAAAVITVRFNDNGTIRILVKVTLQIGDHLEYIDAHGWKVLDADGNFKGAGQKGDTGSAGPSGAAGAIGGGGIGPRGSDGATWLAGTGEPAPSQGKIGDFYLNMATADIWHKLQIDLWPARWIVIGSVAVRGLAGPAGLPGRDGRPGRDGMPGAAGSGSVNVGDIIILQDQKTSGTHGGTFTTGAWRTRDLNTKVSDASSICSLSSNQMTLASGTYLIWASAPAYFCNVHQAKLYNVTDSADILLGTSEYSASDMVDSMTTRSIVNGIFTIGSGKALEIRHEDGHTQSTAGFGVANGFGTEVYTTVLLLKLS